MHTWLKGFAVEQSGGRGTLKREKYVLAQMQEE